jgi:hypothetical protein
VKSLLGLVRGSMTPIEAMGMKIELRTDMNAVKQSQRVGITGFWSMRPASVTSAKSCSEGPGLPEMKPLRLKPILNILSEFHAIPADSRDHHFALSSHLEPHSTIVTTFTSPNCWNDGPSEFHSLCLVGLTNSYPVEDKSLG